jgi:hypothetical protein
MLQSICRLCFSELIISLNHCSGAVIASRDLRWLAELNLLYQSCALRMAEDHGKYRRSRPSRQWRSDPGWAITDSVSRRLRCHGHSRNRSGPGACGTSPLPGEPVGAARATRARATPPRATYPLARAVETHPTTLVVPVCELGRFACHRGA